MADRSSLAGKYAIVTGSTQGLGEAIARLFAERGVAGLIICGRNVERGRAVAADLNADTCQVHFVQADLAAVDDCRRIVAAADQHFGTVHVLINAAGVSDRGTIWNTTPELWDWIMAVNVRGVFLGMKYVLTQMLAQKTGGAIVNTASVAGLLGAPGMPAYVASKHAVIGLTKSASGEVAYYLPAGRWTNWFTHQVVDGGGWRREVHGFDTVPLWIREGAVVPVVDEEGRVVEVRGAGAS